MTFIARIFLLLSLCLTTALAQTNQTHTGTLFNFIPAVGACGISNTPAQIVASVSQQVFSTFPGATANPNKNPICTHTLTITSGGKNLTAPIVDFFTAANAQDNVGLSPAGFTTFAPLDDGIVPGVTWHIN